MLAITLMLPAITFAQTNSQLQGEALQQLIATLKARILFLQSQLAEQSGVVVEAKDTVPAEWRFNYSKANVKLGIGKDEVEYDEEDVVNIFLVRNGRLYEDDKWTKNTDSEDYRIWNIFNNIVGEDFVDEYIYRYATYRFSDTGVLGFVQLLGDKEPAWGLAINAQASNFSSKKWTKDLVSVLIHEYAHILTLNADQINFRIKKQYSCNNYVSVEGCARSNSYLNAFVDNFWEAEDLKHSSSYASYYKEHPDDFITEYAAKRPEEDMAESFTQFVLYSKPTGDTKKDQKILFFYDYPELVKIRTHIRNEVKQYYNQ